MAELRCPACHRDFGEGYLKCPYDGSALIDPSAIDTPDPMLGRTIAETYQLVRRLGAGGMGSVYEARHLRLGTSFAIKLLHPQLSINEEMLARFHREARSASQLKHPGIIDVFDVNKTPDNIHYIVQEYLEGMPLSQLLLEHGVLEQERGVKIAAQVCDAMAAAHGRGIVHRDLKPENVFLLADDVVKVLDFGIAKMQEGEVKLTRDMTAMGTPDYIPPEQAKNAEAADFRSDIYSLGVVLYRTFTGRLPYEMTNPLLALDAVCNKPPVLPRQRRPDLPEAVEAVILRAMERDPAQRFGSMLELKEALLALAPAPATRPARPPRRTAPGRPLSTPVPDPAHQPTLAPEPAPAQQRATAPQGRPASIPATIAGGGPTPVPAGQVQPTTASRQRGRSSRTVALLIGLGVVALAGGGGLAAFLLTRTPEPKPTPKPKLAVDPTPSVKRQDAGRTPDTTAVTETQAAENAGTRGMLLISGGTFRMGRDRGTRLERPAHGCIVKSFYLETDEVTRAEFAAFLDRREGRALRASKRWQTFDASTDPDLPITGVSWEEADLYCRSGGRRLPTEAEWEYAARRGGAGLDPPGPEHANFRRARGDKGSLRPASAPLHGLSDMIGNAAEWVQDRFGWYTRTCGKTKRPRPPAHSYRIIRGGGFDDHDPKRLTAAFRLPQPPTFRWKSLGFRCARSDPSTVDESSKKR
jgi:serine/threonine-protein kinase